MIFYHALAWVAIFVATLLVSPFLVEADTYARLISEGADTATKSVGEIKIHDVARSTEAIYVAMSTMSGVEAINTSQCGGDGTSGFFSWVSERTCTYSASAKNSLYLASFRIAQILQWSVFFAPFFVAATIDGMVHRKIKLASFRYSSPALYKGLWHTSIAFIAILFVSVLVAVSWPVAYVPLMLAGVAIVIRNIISNIQPSV